MYPNIESYILAVADYVAAEFTDFEGQEAALATQLHGASFARLVRHAFEQRYLPCILGDVVVLGGTLDSEAARCTNPYFV